MRIPRFCTLTFVMLVAAAVPAVGDVNPALIQQVGNNWYVTPANDVDVDGDNLAFVVESSQAGDTVVLRAGTFWIGKPGMSH